MKTGGVRGNSKKPREVPKSKQSNIEGKTWPKAKLQRTGEKFKITSESPSQKEKRYKKAFTNSKTNIYIYIWGYTCISIYYIYIFIKYIESWILFLLRLFSKIYVNICYKTAQKLWFLRRLSFPTSTNYVLYLNALKNINSR